jgi:O-antigen ligase
MSQAEAPGSFFAKWCGWVVVVALALAPIMGWLWYMGFPGLLVTMGLLSLPALRVDDRDRPVAILLLCGLVWAAMSTAWSPYHPTKPDNNTALKLAVELPFYWLAYCGARRADPRLKQLALKVLVWGSVLFGLILLVDFATDVGLYERLHVAFYEPIRHDLAQVQVAHATFVLALIWPLAFAAAARTGTPYWLLAPIPLGFTAAALRFGADAPVISLVLSGLVFAAVLRWPKRGPLALAGLAVVYALGAPLVIWLARATGHYGALEANVPLSWSERMGFWSHAVDWLKDHPLRGWGLEASRMFSPGIVLHPHDDALQVWLELGAVGAALFAGIWWRMLRGLARASADAGAAGVAAAASVYLLFGALNFDTWHEWWLALGALVAVCAALLAPPTASETST